MPPISGNGSRGTSGCALTPGGGYAQYCAVPAGHCLPLPKGWTPIEAASLPETTFTVWINVFERGRLGPGETLLVQGGASGIGVTAIQMVHALVTASSPPPAAPRRPRPASPSAPKRAINCRTEDFVEVIQQVTTGRGVDVILDMVAGDYVPRGSRAWPTTAVCPSSPILAAAGPKSIAMISCAGV